MFKCSRFVLALFLAVFIALPVFAQDKGVAKLTFGENKWIALHYLLQAQGYTQNIFDNTVATNEYGYSAPLEYCSDAVWSNGFQLRRSRVILKGQVTKSITFFMETDDFKVGNQGPAQTYESSGDAKGLFTQDAFVSYKAADELQISFGMILLPFMHHNRQSAVSLLGVDYNGAVIPFGGTTNVWRDTGIEFRGLVLPTIVGKKKGLIDYRVGIWRGPVDRDLNDTHDTGDDVNPDSQPRYCGRVQLNLMDPETGFFYSGNYLGKKKVVSAGVGLDYQKHAVRKSYDSLSATNDLKSYLAWTVDATVDYALGEGNAVAFQCAYTHVKNKPGSSVTHQYGYFAQAGYLLQGNIQFVAKYITWIQERADTDTDPVTGINSISDNEKAYFVAGVNYFFNGHNANVKLEYQNPMEDDHKANSGEKKATLQCQIFI